MILSSTSVAINDTLAINILTNEEHTIKKNLDAIRTEIQYLREDITESSKDSLFLGITANTVFTVVITLIVFSLGVFIDRRKKTKLKLEQQEKTRKYFQHTLKQFRANILLELIKAIQIYNTEIDIDRALVINPPRIYKGENSITDQIDKRSILDAYSYNEVIYELFNVLYATKDLLKSIEHYHSMVLNQYNNMRSELVQKQEDFDRIVADFILNKSYLKPNHPLFKLRNKIGHIYDCYYKGKVSEVTISVVHNELVQKIQTLLIKEKGYLASEDAKNIMEIGRASLTIYHHIKLDINDVKQQFDNYTQAFKALESQLSKILPQIGIMTT